MPRFLVGLVWPWGHAPHQVFRPVVSVLDPWFVAGLLFLAGGAVLTVASSRRDRRYAVGVVWFVLVLLPTTVVPIPIVYADRFLYLAMPFVVGAICDSASCLPRPAFRPTVVAGGAIVVVLAVSASRYQSAWRASLSLWEHSVIVEPRSCLAWSLLSKVRMSRFDFQGGAEAMRRAVEAEPGNRIAWQYLALAEVTCGRTDEAERIMRRLIGEEPDDPVAWANLATIRERAFDPEGAEEAYHMGLSRCPDSRDLLKGLGRLCRKAGREEEARQAFARALEVDPHDAEAAELMRR